MANVQKPKFDPDSNPLKKNPSKAVAKRKDEAPKEPREYTSTSKPASPIGSKVQKPALPPQKAANKKNQNIGPLSNPTKAAANENKYANPHPKPASSQKKGIMNRLRRGK